jgi:hypothetical protein
LEQETLGAVSRPFSELAAQFPGASGNIVMKLIAITAPGLASGEVWKRFVTARPQLAAFDNTPHSKRHGD